MDLSRRKTDGDADRLNSVLVAAGNVTIYAYDANNNLTSKTNRNNQAITYTYDPLNRLAQCFLNENFKLDVAPGRRYR